jgi:hypothetical protein
MAKSRFDRIMSTWNAFRNEEKTRYSSQVLGPGSSRRPDRTRLVVGNDRSIVASIYTRIGIDIASLDFVHAKLDEEKRYSETVESNLNNCLMLEANLDQTSRSFFLDLVVSMFDEGVVAVIPVETMLNPIITGSFDILTMRTAKVLEWYPRKVRVRAYNEWTGEFQELTLPKQIVAIIQNPLYSVMNEPNSTLSRLIYKLNLLDAIDKQSGSGKLDIIIQLPYVIKSKARKEMAEQRRASIQEQLTDSQYGIAYMDATEKVIQLNRPAENQLMDQITYLTEELYNQLGITKTIFDGTADEATMLNYYNRTIDPIAEAITQEFNRKFLTKNSRTRGHAILYFRNPFKLVPVGQLAEIADKFIRNEIVTKNEFRSVLGYKPSKDAGADKLQNPNIASKEAPVEAAPEEDKEGV